MTIRKYRLFLTMTVTYDPEYDSDNGRNVGLFSAKDWTTEIPSTQPRPSTSQTATTRPHLQDKFRRRQVFSDSSSSSEDDKVDDEIWQGNNEVESENITHSFDFNEIPGPSRHVPNLTNPIDYFFFYSSLTKHLCNWNKPPCCTKNRTNISNASPHSLLRQWLPVSFTEIKAFNAVVLNMGFIRKPSIRSY